MPSPIAHLAAGYAIYHMSRSRIPHMKVEIIGPLAAPLVVAAGFSLLPDVDSLAGLLLGNFGRYHNNATHSLIVGLGVSLIFGGVMRIRERTGFCYWLSLSLLSYETHILMDSATISRGVMAFWPFIDERYLLPFRLFYGFHWSDGLLSVRHIWTFLTEGVFAAVLVAIVHLLTPQKRLNPKQES